MEILDREDKELRNKTIPMVKVQWRNHTKEEVTWELERCNEREIPSLVLSFEDETSVRG